MTNAAKRKGDAGERAAVVALVALAPDLVVPQARRKLGAGRKDDTGDLDVFADVAIQVKTMADLSKALRQAALGATVQAARARVPFHLGMAPVPRARAESVRWIASCTEWPDLGLGHDELARFGTPTAAVDHVRNERLGVPRARRIASVERKDCEIIVIAPIEAWLDAYRRARREFFAPAAQTLDESPGATARAAG